MSSALQNLLCGVFGVHFLDDALEDTGLVKYEGAAECAHDGLSVHLFLADGPECLMHLAGGVGKKREG